MKVIQIRSGVIFSLALSFVGVLSLVLAGHNLVLAESERIGIYTYHTHPPFITETGKGLSYDLAEYLSKRSGNSFRFSVEPLSRPGVDKVLQETADGIVPWVNPVWFKDLAETKYFWCKGALMSDGNAIVSHNDRKIVYNGPESLSGLKFGGLHGHRYTGIDEFIRNTGKARRVDTENHIENFRKLSLRRIDVTLTPISGAAYILKREGYADTLYISPKLHSEFDRRVIIANRRNDLKMFIEDVIRSMAKDSSWTEIMDRYR